VEMMLAVAVVEGVRGAPLSTRDVSRFVRTYVSRSRAPFISYHTTAAAVARLQAAVGLSSLDLAQPPPSAVPALLDAMARDPGVHGCRVLRDMLQAGAAGNGSDVTGGKYGVRRGLIVDVIAAIHAIVWNPSDPLRQRVQYLVQPDPHDSGRGIGFVEGAHEPPRIPQRDVTAVVRRGHAVVSSAEPPALPPPAPGAMLVVQVRPDCQERGRTVLMPTATTVGPRGVVLHPTVVSARRNATAALLTGAFALDAGTAATRMADKGAAWAEVAEAAWRREVGNALSVQRVDVMVV